MRRFDVRTLVALCAVFALVAGAGSARAQEEVPPPPKDAVDVPPAAPAEATPPVDGAAAEAPPAEAAEIPPPAGPPPLWRNEWVAERAPGIYGQTGVVRVISARAGRGGQFDAALHARYFFSPDYIATPHDNDVAEFQSGVLSGGFSLFDIAEIGVAADFAAIAGSRIPSRAQVGFANVYPSLKLGITLLPVAFGVDVRGFIPSQVFLVDPDFSAFGVTGTGLFTLDLYEGWGIPMKLHVNGGYTYQNAGYSGPDYFLEGLQGEVTALLNEYWYYSHVDYGLALELPFPFVTPYVEFTGKTALFVVGNDGQGRTQPYDYLADSHLVITPGVRVTVARGVAIDLGADLGLGGTGGFLAPELSKLVPGQPPNPGWAVRAAISATFDPYSTQPGGGAAPAGSGGSTATSGAAFGRLEGCVVDDAGAPVAGAVVGVAEAGTRLVTDERGCFALPVTPAGPATLSVSSPEIDTITTTATVKADEIAKVDVTARRSAQTARVAGVVVSDGDEALDAAIEIDGRAAGKAVAGTFDVETAAGAHQIVTKAEGYLAQGARVVVDAGGRAPLTFVLKRVPKKRAASLGKDRVETTTIVPFEFGKPRLLRAAEFILDDVADLLLTNPQIEAVRVDGYPEQGGDNDAPTLPAARAQAVVDYLVARGISPARLSAAAGTSDDPKQKGKRIDFVIVKESGERPAAAAAPPAAAPEEPKGKKKKGGK